MPTRQACWPGWRICRSGSPRPSGAWPRSASICKALPDQQAVAESLALFDPVWEALTPHERCQALQLLVEKVDYDGNAGQIAITFQQGGIQALADQLAQHAEGVSA